MLKQVAKLVRDKIPDIISSSGRTPTTRKLDDQEFKQELSKKLTEEVAEFLEDYSNEELADLLQVVHSFAELNGITIEELEAIRKEKKAKNGGFEDRIFLESIE